MSETISIEKAWEQVVALATRNHWEERSGGYVVPEAGEAASGLSSILGLAANKPIRLRTGETLTKDVLRASLSTRRLENYKHSR